LALKRKNKKSINNHMKIQDIIDETVAGSIGSIAMPFFRAHRRRKDRNLRRPAGEGMLRREPVDEKWSEEYKQSINCSNPKGFSQKAHCQGRKKNG
jgi:hypothetical protein